MAKALGGGSLDEAIAEMGPYLTSTEATAPDIIDDLRGMVDGAGVAFETLFVLDAAEELNQAAGRFACTAAGITPADTADEHVVLAHNEDSTAGRQGYLYLIRADPTDAPAFVAISYAGLSFIKASIAPGWHRSAMRCTPAMPTSGFPNSFSTGVP